VTPGAKRNLAAAGSGLVFGAGLVVSGMTRPAKVLAFLDIFGEAWDPSLAFVMLGAIGVAALAFRWSRRSSAPVAAPTFSIPAKQPLDASLVGGAALFGVGWGLSGYCPGPSVVALASGGLGVVVFVAAVFVGMLAAARLERRAEDSSNSAGELRGPVTS
jgi:uncharacterized membrane protein YedE/YeeE